MHFKVSQSFILISSIILLIIGITSSVFAWHNGFFTSDSTSEDTSQPKNEEPQSSREQPEQEIPIVSPTHLEVSLTFWGDIFLGRGVRDWSAASNLGYQYPFSQLSTFPKDSNEHWIGNLECPVTDSQITPYEEETLLKFNCDPEFLPYLSQWFRAVSLSNNHTDNMNEVDGFHQTKKFLDEHNIRYFGHYDNQIDDTCAVIEFPATPVYSQTDQTLLQNGQAKPEKSSYVQPIALCGYHTVFRLATEAELDAIIPFTSYPTFVLPHMGAEYTTTADPLKQTMFRSLIDRGADAVIGGHPHTVQNSEIYEGKLIAYSLGNFIFDQQFNNQVTRGLGIRSRIRTAYPFQPGSDPEITYPKPLVSDSSNKITKLADPAETDRILKQATWNW